MLCRPLYTAYACRQLKYAVRSSIASISARVSRFTAVAGDTFNVTKFIRIFSHPAGSVAAKSSSSCDSHGENYGTEFFKVNN